MRTSLSDEQLSFLFGVCRRTIENHMNSAREDLHKNLVPQFINRNDRSVFLAHTTPISKVLFDIPDDKACIVFDATYRLAQKSANYAGQKHLWSEQKKMPLVKPMVGCSSDGFVLYVFGPFDATHNDATILQDCFQRYANDMSTIHEGDTILVDRGFRDVLNFLTEEKNLKAYCPGLGQLNTAEANASRCVTKCRWVIEQVFGCLKKKFKIFSLPAHNTTLKHDLNSLYIAFALLNLFHKPILKSRLNVPNRLQIIVQEFNLPQLRAPFLGVEYTSLDNEENNRLIGFPELSMDDLYYLSLGPYQIRNAISLCRASERRNILGAEVQSKAEAPVSSFEL